MRLYAEHPLTFLPQTGRLERLQLPEEIRVDAGIEAGDEMPVAYDPLIAKLIAHGETREDAFDTLSRALRATRVPGTTTNLGFLRWLVDHPAVRAGETTTAFLTEHPPLSLPTRAPAPGRATGASTAAARQPAPEARRRPRRSRARPMRRTAPTRRAPWSRRCPASSSASWQAKATESSRGSHSSSSRR